MNDPDVDLVGDSEGVPVVVLGFEGDPRGFSHGVLPAHSCPPRQHGSLDGAHVGGQLLRSEPSSPFSVQNDPCRDSTTGGGSPTNVVSTRSALCCSPKAYPWARRECTSRTERRQTKPCTHRR